MKSDRLATPPRAAAFPVRPVLAVLALAALHALQGCASGPPRAAAAASAPAGVGPAACLAAQLSLDLDDMGGWFNGMSHSGTLLVVRNLGPQACSLPARPALRWQDGERRPVSLAQQADDGGQAAARAASVAIPVGAEATSKLRWVSGDVYGAGNCAEPAQLGLEVGGEVLWADFGRLLCGSAGGPPTYTATPLQRDPAYAPPAGARAPG